MEDNSSTPLNSKEQEVHQQYQGQYPPQQGPYPPPQQGPYPPPQQGSYPPPQQGGYPPQQGLYQQGPPSYAQAVPIQTQPGSYQQGAQQQTTVVYATAQHQPLMMEPQPPNHFGLALVTCLICCWPVSLVALIRSSEVNSAYAAGDIVRAKRASEDARKYSMISLGCGIFLWIASVVFFIIYFAAIVPSILDSASSDY